MANSKFNPQENSDEYVALEDTRGFVLMQFRLEFNERQVRDFIDQTGLETMSVGNRVFFSKEKFVAKFPVYISRKNELEKQKRKNRASGGKEYNLRVDAVF